METPAMETPEKMTKFPQVNNKITRITSSFTHCSGASIVEFEQVSTGLAHYTGQNNIRKPNMYINYNAVLKSSDD